MDSKRLIRRLPAVTLTLMAGLFLVLAFAAPPQGARLSLAHGRVREVIEIQDAVTPDPLATLAARQRHVLLAELIRHLPEREQQVLALYYVEEMTMLETGRTLGIGESRVSQLHSRAVRHLRSALHGQRPRAEL